MFLIVFSPASYILEPFFSASLWYQQDTDESVFLSNSVRNGEALHFSFTIGHLAAKRHPSGGFIKFGGKPSIVANFPFLETSNLGTDLKRPIV